MAFIYEKTPQKEIEKYDLDDLWNYYHVGAYIMLPDRCFEHYWIVDRQRNIWLYAMNHMQKEWNHSRYLFHYKSRTLEIVVKDDSDLIYVNPKLLDDVEFADNIVIKKFNFTSEKIDFNIEEIKNIFKEALTVIRNKKCK